MIEEADKADEQPEEPGEASQSLSDVLASIRELVTAETEARVAGSEENEAEEQEVLMLTPAMRVDPDLEMSRSGEILSDGIGKHKTQHQSAPILDEEALRGVVNSIVREELQGEMGDRISRNLRKLIRRELNQLLDERERESKRT